MELRKAGRYEKRNRQLAYNRRGENDYTMALSVPLSSSVAFPGDTRLGEAGKRLWTYSVRKNRRGVDLFAQTQEREREDL